MRTSSLQLDRIHASDRILSDRPAPAACPLAGGFSEAHVGTGYLSDKGVDPSQIITEQGSGTTYDTVEAAARLMHSNGWTRALIVSDGFHLYRVKRIFGDSQIEALASPVPNSPLEITLASRVWYSLREVLLLTTYRLGRVVRAE